MPMPRIDTLIRPPMKGKLSLPCIIGDEHHWLIIGEMKICENLRSISFLSKLACCLSSKQLQVFEIVDQKYIDKDKKIKIIFYKSLTLYTNTCT